jgi:hypothetical protein
VPQLRRGIARQPHLWLGLLLLLALLAALDAQRDPARQVASRVAVAAIRSYQWTLSPLLAGRVQCRYQPSCSHYAVEALRKKGLAQGLWLSWRRVRSCQDEVPLGTPDPVPGPTTEQQP